MQKKYIDSLILQYIDANGLSLSDINEDVIVGDLASWLCSRNNAISLLKELYNNYDIDINDFNTIEVGKGNLDTLTSFDSFSKLITPYKDSFIESEVGNRSLVGSNYHFYDGLEDELVHTKWCVTSNPTHNLINGWENIPYKCDVNMTVGVYGSINDKDFINKIYLISNLKNRLHNYYNNLYEIKEDVNYNNNFYSHIVIAKKRVK